MDGQKMNIAVIIDSELNSGGGFQYEIALAMELNRINQHRVYFFVLNEKSREILGNYGIESILIESSFWHKITRYINRQSWFYRLSEKLRLISFFEKTIEKYDIDLVYFTSPSGLALDLIRHNYVITVWDLCHRDHPEFPEVNFYRQFEIREQLYTNVLKKAVAVITDNEITREKLSSWYGVDKNRIHIIPFPIPVQSRPNRRIDVRAKYSIEGDYIYYPAQFWPHKNHVYILEAIKILKQKEIELTAVFSGSDKGNLHYVMQYAKQIGVSEQVKFIGFVPPEEIYSLYENALALVMPTYFGPTNLPPLEAFAIGVPVIYSNLEDMKEQVGDSALLCDLKSPNSLAENLIKLKKCPSLRDELVKKGREKLSALTKSNVMATLEKIFERYEIKLKCWKN